MKTRYKNPSTNLSSISLLVIMAFPPCDYGSVHYGYLIVHLDLERDHPNLIHLRYHIKGWKAICDISIIPSKCNPEHLSVNEIIATEKYVSGYNCQGNETIGGSIQLFNDMVNTADTSSATVIPLTRTYVQWCLDYCWHCCCTRTQIP